MAVLLMRVLLGYRWQNLAAFRQRLQAVLRQTRGPFIFCPNHLTMIDSLILIWALTPAWKAIAHPELFPWNTPEKKNFAHVPPLRFFCYLGKCLPVVRQGSTTQNKAVTDKIQLLLSQGQSLMMFPEGARSVSGRIDVENYSYGVGKILDDARRAGLDPQVICLYLRGQGQTAKSAVPHRNEVFFVDLQWIHPQTEAKGMRATRDLSTQIVQTLAKMEEAYFCS